MGLSPEEVNSILSQVYFEEWVNVPELAPVYFDFTTSKSNESAQLALDYISLGG